MPIKFKENKDINDSYERFLSDSEHAHQMQKAADIVSEFFPDIKKNILDKAEDAFRGYVLLPGSPKREFIGNPPLWHANPFKNKEYNYQLNRMNYWLPMLQAYYFTHNKDYLKKIASEMENWIQNVKPPYDLSDERSAIYKGAEGKEWRILECGIRLYKTWGPCLEHLVFHGMLDQSLFDEIFKILFFQADMIDQMSDRIWPRADHNHYLMENLGLLKFAGMFPELNISEKWKHKAVKSLCKGMKAQVMESGAQIEGCPSYHNSCTFWLALALVMGRRYGISFPSWYSDRLFSMGKWAMYMTRPDGNNIPWGDSDAVSSTFAKSAVCVYLGTGKSDWISYSAYLHQKPNLYKELGLMIWYMEDPQKFADDFLSAVADPQKPPFPESIWNKEMKQVVLRNSWEKGGSMCHFSCRTPVQNLHAHIDPCAIDYSLNGIALASDPGKYTYKDGEDRKNFKSMRWHNTLMINEQDAWEYISSWEYGNQKSGNIIAVQAEWENDMTWAIGYHDNYENQRHIRTLIMLKDGAILIIDRVNNVADEDSISLHFNLDCESVEVCNNGLLITQNNKKHVWLCSTFPLTAVEEAKISLKRDQAKPSKLVTFNEKAVGDKKQLYIASSFSPASDALKKDITIEIVSVKNEIVTVVLHCENAAEKFCINYKNYRVKRAI